VISLDDCIELCGLTEEEVLAIAQHEHIPEIVAAELGNYLACTAEGEERIKSMILEDIAQAAAAGNRTRALALKLVARRFIVNHPACEARHLAKIRYPDRRLAES
jgi:alkanesulfonate monooxygenase SsuD/methylene tetrahydromethanopterin reductase-like flavin-dependent oxidoreductase (luciferase family)